MLGGSAGQKPIANSAVSKRPLATFQNADLIFPVFNTQAKAKSIALTLTVATNRQLSGSPPGGSAPNNGCPHKSK